MRAGLRLGNKRPTEILQPPPIPSIPPMLMPVAVAPAAVAVPVVVGEPMSIPEWSILSPSC